MTRKTVLMVAEKPSLASTLASLLSDKPTTDSRKSVHVWNGTFHGEPATFKMTAVCGHVMELEFAGKYNSWDQVDPVELFSCPTVKKPAESRKKTQSHLLSEAQGCDYLVLWLDCDKEGENICFEVIDTVKNVFKRPIMDVTYRAKFSAITKKDIVEAMNNLGKPNYNESRSVDARLELDLRVGCAFTRFQTKYFQGKYANLDATCISYGPCQTPTLGFCVQRHDEIQTFKRETNWVIQVNVVASDKREVTLDWERVRCFEKDVASMFLNNIREQPSARVVSITSKQKSKTRPQALNTVELMRIGSSGLGLGPAHVMQIAEKLYIQGYISYPRTETTHYPTNFDLKGALSHLQNSPDWGDEVRQLLQEYNPPRKGHDAGDHPPITPMKLASRQSHDFDNDTWRVYDYITRHFIATLSKDCKYSTRTIKFEIGTEIFSTSCNTVISAGYTAVMHWQALSKNDLSLPFVEGEELPFQAKMIECQTSPPDYLTESELITLMEKHGIGTDASIPAHINNICQRNYVAVTPGRRLTPQTLGIVLVHGYQKIDPELVLPTMRSAVEKQLNLIATGQADFRSVLEHTLQIFKLKFQFFVENIEGMDQLFEVSFSTLGSAGKAFSRCGKCRRFLKLIQAKVSRLHCTHCDETYNVPQNGNIRTYKELKCPLDDFDILSWSTGTRGKSFPFCPYCYNNAPFKDMKKGSGCNSCQHPNCLHSFAVNGICACHDCGGVLVLDPSSGPKWKIGCNQCDVIILLFEDAYKVTVEEDTCDCGAQKVTVEYKGEKSKLPNGATEMTGCLTCTPEFAPLVEKQRATASRPVALGKPRNRGRSRPKGKPRQPKDKMAQLAAYFV